MHVGIAASSTPILRDIIGHWRLSGDANDSSGNGGHGVITNATVATDRFGANSAYYFNGSSAKIVMAGGQYGLVGDFTIAAWLWLPGDSTQNMTIASSYAYDTGNRDWWFVRRRNGLDRCLSFFAFGAQQIISTTPIDMYNTWYHVVFTLSSGDARLYVNGVLDQTLVGFGSTLTPSSGLVLGNQGADSSSAPLNGKLDDVRVYDRALVSSEIATLANPSLSL